MTMDDMFASWNPDTGHGLRIDAGADEEEAAADDARFAGVVGAGGVVCRIAVYKVYTVR